MEGEDHVSGLIPEIYYDLIARVAAGVPLILILVFQNHAMLEQLKINVMDWTFFTFVLGLGYLTGHLLTTFSIGLNAIVWRPMVLKWVEQRLRLKHPFESGSPRGIMTEIYYRIDWVTRRDKSGGVILKKMEAACALTDNLFCAWLLIILYAKFVKPIEIGYKIGLTESILISVFLIFSVGIRRIIFIERQDSLLKLLKFSTERERS